MDASTSTNDASKPKFERRVIFHDDSSADHLEYPLPKSEMSRMDHPEDPNDPMVCTFSLMSATRKTLTTLTELAE